MFVRKGQKLGSVLVKKTGTGAGRPTSKEAAKKSAPPAKKAAESAKKHEGDQKGGD